MLDIELLEAVLVILISVFVVLSVLKLRETSQPRRQLRSVCRGIYDRLSDPRPYDSDTISNLIFIFGNKIERRGLRPLMREWAPELPGLFDEVLARRDVIEKREAPAECARLIQQGKRTDSLELDAFQRSIRDDPQIQGLVRDIRSKIGEKILDKPAEDDQLRVDRL